MPSIEVAELSTLIIYAINLALLLALITLKAMHRRRVASHDRRRHEYTSVLSRHMTYEHCTDPITSAMAEDGAFLDALIDVRDVISGGQISTLATIVADHGVITRQVRRLDSRFPLGRRLRAAVALAELGDPTAAGPMMRHLSDREPEIRIQCARGLARIRWTPAIDTIVSRFNVEVPAVRTRFADSLTGFGATATWPLLAYVRINHRYETSGPALALRTVGRLHDFAAVPAILDILDDATHLDISIAAVESLGEIGSPDSLEVLQEMLGDERWQLRAKAASALGGVADSSSLPILLSALSDPNWWVRRNSAGTIAKLPGGIEALYATLDSDDSFAADASAEALIDVGELAAARKRVVTGVSGEEPLLEHMNGRV